MLPALLDEERRLIGRCAWALCIAVACILPVAMPTSFTAGAATTPREDGVQNATDLGKVLYPAVNLGRDPFMPDAAYAATESLDGRSQRTNAPIVRAVVTGAQPRALIDTEGVVRVVSIGDAVGTLIVAAIDAREVVLSDGTRLPLFAQRP